MRQDRSSRQTDQAGTQQSGFTQTEKAGHAIPKENLENEKGLRERQTKPRTHDHGCPGTSQVKGLKKQQIL
ncbi:hypothetical protein A11S_1327 [Micavibrio aeruginosavorus EPB]|uniref:Uncharacterized protein n=1 Tax=Micavibrio aeruginosavorus EPB TaxID=349215 RepID=M4VJB2_9BACT|nr:hypothetical protein A11S_1327 [Micavibrio aeruginosavorus EPB]